MGPRMYRVHRRKTHAFGTPLMVRFMRQRAIYVAIRRRRLNVTNLVFLFIGLILAIPIWFIPTETARTVVAIVVVFGLLSINRRYFSSTSASRDHPHHHGDT